MSVEEPGQDDAQGNQEYRAPKLPDPPVMSFKRQTPKADPAETFLKSRGIGAQEAGSLGKAMGIGTALVGSIIGGGLLGWLVDSYLIKSTTPWGLMVGFLLGTFSGFANMIRIANELNK